MPSENLLTPPGESPHLRHLPGLDGARGLAVLCVLLDHAADVEMRFFPGADLNRLGKYGVYLFFVLSAFLLTHQFSLRRREELLDPQTWLRYAARRFLRIFPLYTVVLLVYVKGSKFSLTDLWTHLLLQDGRRVFWTIPVEVKFYLLLPFIVLALFWAGRKHWLWGVAGGLVAAGVAAAIFSFERAWSLQETVHLAPNLAPFLMGTAAAVLYGALQRRELGSVWKSVLEFSGVAALGAIFFRVPVVYNFLFPSDDPVGKFGQDPAVCGALWSVFLLAVLLGKGWLARVLQWSPLRFLGLISFSAYLWHGRYLTTVDDLAVPPVIRLLLFLAIVVAVATVSYYLLERPLLRRRPRRPPSDDPPAIIAAPLGIRSAA